MDLSIENNPPISMLFRRFALEMKCHCKYCSPVFFCQREDPRDFCYYRYAINQNTTDDYGCVQSDGAKFFCNTTDTFYRTECCLDLFCNTRDRPSTTPTTLKKSLDYSWTLLFVVSLALILLLISLFRRKSRVDGSTKAKSSRLENFSSDASDILDEHVPLEVRRVHKQITFLGQLGQGRHARVRLALFGQQYRAIKMFEARFLNEFEREQKIFQTDLLQHPNILAFFGADFFAKGTETCHMLIFEWHPNGTLYDVLKENPQKLTIDAIFQYSISLADGLAHLHAIKYGTEDRCKPQMAHCDLKSSNILVKLNGDCCLSDFSLAVRCDPHTQEIQGGGIERLYHRVGTKLYMPPELLHPQPTFHFDRIQSYQQADVYSLTLVLWELANCFALKVHSRPYETQLPLNFTVENLIQLVCRDNARPTMEFSVDDPIFCAFIDLFDLYWSSDPCERHSAANLQDQLRQIRLSTLFSSLSGSVSFAK